MVFLLVCLSAKALSSYLYVYITDSVDLVYTINGCACVQFQENEKKRYRAETLRFELKHQHQLEELRAAADTTIRELEQLQNEKRQYFFLSITVEFH